MTREDRGPGFLPAVACAAAGAALFQFWGNATHGYIATNSLFYWWGFQWVNPESETEHAWLVLGLSLFLLWRNLRRGGPDERPAAVDGAWALVGGLLLHTLGYIAQQPRVSIVALLLFIWGVLSLGGGRRWSRASAFPLGFMVFAIPVNALDTLGFWLQMGVVQAGERIAHLAGIAVIRNGTQLFGPGGRYQYDVVAACSGVRSLMALTALSLFIGYLWFRPLWVRAMMLLLCFPLVYVGNVARISSIIFAAQWGGRAWGDRVHDGMGFGVFLIVIGGILAASELVARARPGWAEESAPSAPPPAPAGRPARSLAPIAIAVFALASADAAFLSFRSSRPPDERPGVLLERGGANPAELPTYLGSDWMGHEVEPEAIERSILPPDTGFSRKLYLNLEKPGEQVLLSIVLSGRDRTSIHRPELCLVGQGWTIDGSASRRFAYPGHARASFEATVLRVHREWDGSQGRRSTPELVVYWFVGDGQIVRSQGRRMLYDAWERVVHGRAPRWAYVLLKTGAGDGEEQGLARIQSVLDASLPSFQPAIESGGG